MTPAPKHHQTGAPAIAIFTVVVIGVLLLFGWVFRPSAAQLKGERAGAYSEDPMRAALTLEKIAYWREQVTSLGNRFPGTPGHHAAQQFLKEFYSSRGFEVGELNVPTTTPVVEASSLKVGGQAIAITPFQPNLFQPDTTGESAITGRLILFDESTLAKEKDFHDVIAVVDASKPVKKLGLNMRNYLSLGVKALVIIQSEETPADWGTWSGLVSEQPINLPRVYATSEILNHIGKPAQLDLRVRYQTLPVPTLIATRPASVPKKDEAVVLSAHYDTYSLLPWHTAPPIQNGLLAQHLALIDSLYQYETDRDLIVIASGSQFNNLSGEAAVLQIFGPNLERSRIGTLWQEALARHRKQRIEAREAVETIRTEDGALSNTNRFAQGQVRYVIEALLYEKTHENLQARARFEALPKQDPATPEYQRFQQTNREMEKIRALLGVPFASLVRDYQEELHQIAVPSALGARLKRLEAYHLAAEDYYEKAITYHRLAGSYRNLIHLSTFLVPAQREDDRETITWLYGRQDRNFDQQDNQYGLALREVSSLISTSSRDQLTTPLPSSTQEKQFSRFAIPSSIWSQFNYPSATFVNPDRAADYHHLTNPFHRVTNEQWHSIQHSLKHASAFALAVLHGSGTIRPPRRLDPTGWTIGGRVLVSGVGQAVIPSFPLADAVLGNKEPGHSSYPQGMGYYPLHLTQSDPYGEYLLEFKPVRLIDPNGYNLQAFDYDANGLIRTAKDEGQSAQKLFRSVDLPWRSSLRNITLVTFPATGVTVADLINPQTLSPYASVSFMRSQGLSLPSRVNQFASPEVTTIFMEPNTRFFIGFNAGSPDNELVQSIRAFALGAPDPNQSRDINGEGFIAAERPIFHNAYQQTAKSMVRVNSARAALQSERHMLDPMAQGYLATSQDHLAQAQAPDAHWRERLLQTWDSITYSIVIHPLLRANISQAILSVIWYLGLLVPFVFFFEKLVFGYSDIRYQLAAQISIFLLSFALLRFLHPAFEMIRSSVIILLGFGIFLICMAMTVFFTSKASENLELLRKKQLKLKAADVNTLGILATSFLLGLNNMHRRKVRTGLTCATLVLITFAMIAFTSIYDNYEEQQTVVGPASYQGLLIKKEQFAPFVNGEIVALATKYDDQYPVYVRRAVVGSTNPQRESLVPSLNLSHHPNENGALPRRTQAKTVLSFSPKDPIGASIPLEYGRWLSPQSLLHATPEVLLSDQMAEALGLSRASVESTHGAVIELNGRKLTVVGVFSADRLDSLKDLDGQPLLPFDVEALQTFERRSGSVILADESEPRVPGAYAIIGTEDLGEKENGGTQSRIVSVVVDLGSANFQQARNVIRQYIEQSGLRTVYGLDGAASVAIRRRNTSFEGLVDLIIPLFIAAITVLNTMKGSVHERKDELYVYNAVGIAPRYIFAMFFAESLVYAIVGSVLGYFLSQGVGVTLTALDMTGGLNMTFASLNSVYASLAVMAAVFASTWFPARTAVGIAATADDSGWKLPNCDEGALEFDLPFLFDSSERIAVVSFFRQFLLNHTEGDGGTFQASAPVPILSPASCDVPTPGLHCQIWLKPFDLGVSQTLKIVLPRDPQSGEFIARLSLVHESGTREAWKRLNGSFIARLRRQFLHWRVISNQEKERLLLETKSWFENAAQS